MIGNWNPKITTGGGWTRTLTFTQGGAAFSLVSYTAVMTLTPPSGTPTTLSTGNGKISINGAGGTVTPSLTATEVNALDWSQGVVNSVLTLTPPSATGEAIVLSGIASLVEP